MTLKELRRKYYGVSVRVDEMPSSFNLNSTSNGITLEWRTGNELIYSATIDLDIHHRIKAISCMSAARLISDDATRETYHSTRVAADEYDILEHAILSIIDEQKENEQRNSALTLGDVMDSLGQAIPIYLFVNQTMLGMVGSEKIGFLSDSERKTPVVKTAFNHELGKFRAYIYLADHLVPQKWK